MEHNLYVFPIRIGFVLGLFHYTLVLSFINHWFIALLYFAGPLNAYANKRVATTGTILLYWVSRREVFSVLFLVNPSYTFQIVSGPRVSNVAADYNPSQWPPPGATGVIFHHLQFICYIWRIIRKSYCLLCVFICQRFVHDDHQEAMNLFISLQTDFHEILSYLLVRKRKVYFVNHQVTAHRVVKYKLSLLLFSPGGM